MREIPVEHLIGLLSRAYGKDPAQIVDEIAQVAATPTGDGDPTRETILNYVKEPVQRTARGRSITRRNRLTPVHHKFAHLVINYLDGRHPSDSHENVPFELSENPAWQDARAVCLQVLRNERDRRFERALGSDPATHKAVEQLVGAYAICRRESSDERYHQELFILRNHGGRSVPRCYCTYVMSSAVMRGEWITFSSMLSCDMSGMRADNTHEVCSLYLSHLSDHTLLSGFLAGTGTEVKIPVAMPIVAIRIPEASNSILALGDQGDEAILRAFGRVKSNLDEVSPKLHEILSGQMNPVLFRASLCNPQLREAFGDGTPLIDDSFRAFCEHPGI